MWHIESKFNGKPTTEPTIRTISQLEMCKFWAILAIFNKFYTKFLDQFLGCGHKGINKNF